jgi:hypothetical protein
MSTVNVSVGSLTCSPFRPKPIFRYQNLVCWHLVGLLWLRLGPSQSVCLQTTTQTQRKRYTCIYALNGIRPQEPSVVVVVTYHERSQVQMPGLFMIKNLAFIESYFTFRNKFFVISVNSVTVFPRVMWVCALRLQSSSWNVALYVSTVVWGSSVSCRSLPSNVFPSRNFL